MNPQRCFIYFYETWEVEKDVVDLETSQHEKVNADESFVLSSLQELRSACYCSLFYHNKSVQCDHEGSSPVTFKLVITQYSAFLKKCLT